MPSSLRTRLGQSAAVFAVLGVLFHWVGARFAYGVGGAEQAYSGSIGGRFSVGSTSSALGSACLTAGVVLVAGIVASLVIEEALDRRLFMEADFDGDEEDSDPASEKGED